MLGWVEDLIDLYNNCWIFVVLICFVAGIFYKVYEVVVYGLFIVSIFLIG